MTDVLCPLPFVNIHIRPDGCVDPCCSWKDSSFGNINTDKLDNIWNNSNFRALRTMMMNQMWPDGCSSCKMREDNGFANMRRAAHYTHKDYQINDILSVKFDEWDIRNTNLCNLKCKTCGPTLSSLHNKGVEIKVPNNQIYEIVDRDVKTVKKIYFAGGEPLINDFHYYVIDKLIENDRSDCWLQYSTNLTKLDYKNHNIIDKWNFFDTVRVYGSIDAIGSKNDNIRTNSNWSILEKNLNVLAKEKLYLSISVCVSNLNVADVPEIYFYFKEKNIPATFHNILTRPAKYRFDAMTIEETNQALSNLSKYIDDNDVYISDICKNLTKILLMNKT